MVRRPVNVFALSFLDCICCGFGAVILVFMIISAKIQEVSNEKLEGLESNRVRLESLAMAGERVLAQLRAELGQTSNRQSAASRIKNQLGQDVLAAEREFEGEKDLYLDAKADLEAHKKKLAELESIKQVTAAIPEQDGSQARSITAEGDRQYLTGLRMGGRHILILVDASASMLASTIVNVVRLRYLPDKDKLRSKTVETGGRNGRLADRQHPSGQPLPDLHFQYEGHSSTRREGPRLDRCRRRFRAR